MDSPLSNDAGSAMMVKAGLEFENCQADAKGNGFGWRVLDECATSCSLALS